MSKMGTITVQLEYAFPDDTGNDEIESWLENLELPNEYVEDSFTYDGIRNTVTNKWEN